MKFLRAILGKPAKPKAWDITPASERPAPRKREAFDEPTVAMEPTAGMESTVSMEPVARIGEEPNPFLDDEALDTMQLEADDLEAVDNPYQSYSWKLDPENETRGLKTIAVGVATEKKRGDSANPYDTGSHRRGWKK